MGRDRLVEKRIVPGSTSLTTGQEAGLMPQQVGGLNVAQALQERLGVYILGGYKGQTVFADLDKLVNQPLALVEGIYALDKLDARDILTATIPIASAIGTMVTDELVVPAGELWSLNRGALVSPVESGVGVGDIVQVNFRIKSWQFPDVRGGAVVNPVGRSYWPADQGTAAANTYTVDFPAQGELDAEFRLEARDTITLVATLTGAVAGAALAATLTPFGRKIRRLVV